MKKSKIHLAGKGNTVYLVLKVSLPSHHIDPEYLFENSFFRSMCQAGSERAIWCKWISGWVHPTWIRNCGYTWVKSCGDSAVIQNDQFGDSTLQPQFIPPKQLFSCTDRFEQSFWHPVIRRETAINHEGLAWQSSLIGRQLPSQVAKQLQGALALLPLHLWLPPYLCWPLLLFPRTDALLVSGRRCCLEMKEVRPLAQFYP